MKAVALLRGIGPLNPAMRNANLRSVAQGLGLEGVQTVITTGNVIFDLPDGADPAGWEARLQDAWPRELGFTSLTIVRTAPQIFSLLQSDACTTAAPDGGVTREVTFVKRPIEVREVARGAAWPLTGPGYRVIDVRPGEICWIEEAGSTRTPALVGILERAYAKGVSTRTLRTVRRIADRMT